ncbi:Asp-tRNA(Asn)/Glu-tRNA(Gln) amidotransferase subunit GatA [Desulfoferrobacter suflitae]|uniref:Asp-tRNA(Asn)/Glu-tRNA(Gln) amidotransferase subunit GatA n=1 Tax=Desulfoferrobacter suflitae TaxID=2865782 RepID=UPI00216415A0|nr:Asp-tRNA(Asn)/Glu-tRNA(Gln) amidotransferase subunit GatA [Desulfoferrobacter suflitae]MCK8600393.1 Asp-tRNA(Asn)/Glu-tRNA(Gln) amidotransferase subunit GatA [Desulfoferrobacter suflitae]
MEIFSLTMHDLHELLVRRELSVTEAVRSFLERIQTFNGKLNAYLTVLAEQALQEADRFDNGKKDLTESPLAGVPLAIKDVLCTRGIRTSCGSRILQQFVPPFDATAVEALHRAGAIFLGKTNMDEFAMGSSNENSAYGPCRNPWDLERVPGGSSGGSAAAVAADLCAGALGTDTGGSIRQPASFCGVVGLKPTYGRVSRFGLVAFASSLDQIGPITKDVEDAAILLQAVAGYDRRDSTSVDRPVPDYREALRTPIEGLKLGIPQEYFIDGMNPDVVQAVQRAIQTCRDLGAEIVDLSLPHTDYGVAAYYIIAPAEASSNLARYDGVKYGFRVPDAKDLMDMYCQSRVNGFGFEVKRRIMLGTYALSAGYYDAYYRKASQVRSLIKQDFLAAFEKCDALLAPVSPVPAFKIGEKSDDPLQMYLSDVFTLPASLAGVPGISVPCGFTAEQLPVGLQILGPHFQEELILRVAFHYEQATRDQRPKPAVL